MRNLRSVMVMALWSCFLIVDVGTCYYSLSKIKTNNIEDFPHPMHTLWRSALFVHVILYGIGVEIALSSLRWKKMFTNVASVLLIAGNLGVAIVLVAGHVRILQNYRLLFQDTRLYNMASGMQRELKCCGWDLASVPAGDGDCQFGMPCENALASLLIWDRGNQIAMLGLGAFLQCLILCVNRHVDDGADESMTHVRLPTV